MGQIGVTARTSGPQSWTQCRQRGAAVSRGYMVMLDLAGSDALTADFVTGGGKNAPGTTTTASAPLSTVLPATAGLTHGRVGVAMANALDDGLGEYELGELSDGRTAPVIVEALVAVDALNSVAGAALQIQTGGTLAPGGTGTTFAILLAAATANDGKGPTSVLNYRPVMLYTDGTPADVTAASLSLTGDEGDIITLGPDGETLVALPVDEAFPAPLYNDGLLGVADGDGPGPVDLLTAGEAQVHILAAIEDALTPAHVADPDLFFAHRARSAAFSGLGASGVGAFASHTLQLTGASPSFEVEMVIASKVAPSGACAMWGYPAAGLPDFYFDTDGSIVVRKSSVTLVSTGAGGIIHDGIPRTLRVVFGSSGANSTATIYVDGVQVATGSLAGNWATTSVTSYIGGSALASGQRWPGSIHNVTYTDLVTAASSRTFLMDEVVGDFADTSGNGGLAAVRNGYVSSAAVVSTDGRGMPWQGGVTTIEYAGYTTSGTPQALTADTYFVCATEVSDPTGHFDLQFFVAPAAGRVEVEFVGAIRATALAGTTSLTPTIISPEIIYYTPITFTAVTSINVWKPLAVRRSNAVAAGGASSFYIGGITAADTYDVCGYLSFTFYPTHVPG